MSKQLFVVPLASLFLLAIPTLCSAVQGPSATPAAAAAPARTAGQDAKGQDAKGQPKEASAAVKIDASIKPYKRIEGVSGSLKSIGSDTMLNEMNEWAEGFRKFYPGVQVEIEGKGSGTAPTALEAGTAHFGPMSRTMKKDEMDKFEKKFGYKPTEIRTSVDVLAVYVHKDNPLKSLTLPQVDAIFGKKRNGGHKTDITTWGDLGLIGEWKDRPISVYGRNSASGTYGYFKEHALFKGDFKDSVKEQAGSSAVVQAVASDKFAIGYSGIGLKSADVRALPLSAKPGEPVFEANMENAYTGDYPLSRHLLLYVNKTPNKSLDPLREQFLAYVLSLEGQETVVKLGFIPLPGTIVAEERAKLGLPKH